MTMIMELQLHTAQARHAHDSRDLVTVREICETPIALNREDELLAWADGALALSPHDPGFMARARLLWISWGSMPRPHSTIRAQHDTPFSLVSRNTL